MNGNIRLNSGANLCILLLFSLVNFTAFSYAGGVAFGWFLNVYPIDSYCRIRVECIVMNEISFIKPYFEV